MHTPYKNIKQVMEMFKVGLDPYHIFPSWGISLVDWMVLLSS